MHQFLVNQTWKISRYTQISHLQSSLWLLSLFQLNIQWSRGFILNSCSREKQLVNSFFESWLRCELNFRFDSYTAKPRISTVYISVHSTFTCVEFAQQWCFFHTGSSLDCAWFGLPLLVGPMVYTTAFSSWQTHTEVSVLVPHVICANVTSCPVPCHVGKGAYWNRAILWCITEFRCSRGFFRYLCGLGEPWRDPLPLKLG